MSKQICVTLLGIWKKDKTSFTVFIAMIKYLDERATDAWLLFLVIIIVLYCFNFKVDDKIVLKQYGG